MAKVVVTVPGERVVEEFTALVRQTAQPSPLAPPPGIGLVEISQSTPTELIPGPMGPQGPRGTQWTNGDGPPTSGVGNALGDMYVDDITGDVWQWDGDSWELTGTNIQGSPDTGPQILAKLAPVDGAGSGLDADTLDGHDSLYFATDTDMTAVENKNVSQDAAIALKLDASAYTAADVLAKVKTVDGTGSGLDADLLDGQDSAFYRNASNLNAGTLPAAQFNDTSHGNRGGGALHAAATPSTAGFFTDAPNDAVQYVRQSLTWSPVSVPPGTAVSDTPPVGPLQGQMWFESDSGNTFLFYVDPSGPPGQWVQIAGALPDNASPARTAESYSRMVNGAMQFSQENVNAAGTVSGYYGADQFFTGFVTTGAVSTQRVQNGTPNGSRDRYRVTVTTADTSLAAAEAVYIQTSLEGYRVTDLGYGYPSIAKQAVLRFGFRAPAGTYSVAFRNNGSTRNYAANFTITAGQANIDTEQVIVLPPCLDGAWLVDSGIGLQMFWMIAAGANFLGTEKVWNANLNVLATASNSNGMATVGNVFELFDVGFYKDADNTNTPPKWTMPDFASEYASCMRYYQKTWTTFSGNVTSANGYYATAYLIVPPRTTPSLSYSNVFATSFPATGNGVSMSSATTIQESRTANATGVGVYQSNIVANARM